MVASLIASKMSPLVQALIILLIIVLVKLYCRLSLGRCTSNACLVGKTALITGGNSGIGYQTALALAGRGCRIIIADKNNCERTQREIIAKTGNPNVVIKHFDLASLASVRNLAEDINEHEERLDILINNAGTGYVEDTYTKDGLHLGMQVNHFGPFLLTHLLIGLLKKSAPSRIIFVSSCVAFFGGIPTKKLNSPGRGFKVYVYSKLCNMIASNEFARRLKGTGVTSNSLHPGWVCTPLYYSLAPGNSKWVQNLIIVLDSWVVQPFCKTPEEGAQTSIHLAVAKEVENVTGEHFWDCQVFLGQPFLARARRYCERIWEASEDYVKLLPGERL